MSEVSNSGDLPEVSLKSLRLRSGLFVKIQRTGANATVHEAQFVAAIEGKGVMLTPSGTDSLKTQIAIGEEYLIQGFTGQSDFSFTAQALNVFQAPFAHALFAYPATVKAKKVRKAMRMKTTLPATISPRGENNPLQVSIIDLSVDGAMVLSPRSLGMIGSFFHLAFPIEVEGEHSNLNILTKLCHNTPGDDGQRKIGFSFENLSWDHKLLLNYFLGNVSEENPPSVMT